MEPVETQTQAKPKRAINDWENEGGATPFDFSANREELSPWTARIRQAAFQLAAQVRARPLLSLAAAVGVGVVLGGGLSRKSPRLRSLLGLLVMPTLKRAWSAAS